MTVEEQAEEYIRKLNCSKCPYYDKGTIPHVTCAQNEEIKEHYYNISTEICKKILEEVEKAGFVYFGTPTINKLKEIIKDLGVDL